MKARLRADLRGYGESIPVLLPNEGKYLTEADVDRSTYVGYIQGSNPEYEGMELLLLDNKMIAVYSIDLDIEVGGTNGNR